MNIITKDTIRKAQTLTVLRWQSATILQANHKMLSLFIECMLNVSVQTVRPGMGVFRPTLSLASIFYAMLGTAELRDWKQLAFRLQAACFTRPIEKLPFLTFTLTRPVLRRFRIDLATTAQENFECFFKRSSRSFSGRVSIHPSIRTSALLAKPFFSR
ncbi:MAG: hypothetical protein WCE49_11590 [Terrimicrobiaceae bacterium]